MNFTFLDNKSKKEVTALFASVFATSEGENEGKIIGNLVAELSSSIDDEQVLCIGAYEDETILGAIFFTRLMFNKPIKVYMLAPVAVSTSQQGLGVGQALINFGLQELKSRAVNVVITYGDPAFYSKVGFQALPETVIQAPLKLSMPVGWLGQSLTEEPIPTISERPTCVREFNNPVYW